MKFLNLAAMHESKWLMEHSKYLKSYEIPRLFGSMSSLPGAAELDL